MSAFIHWMTKAFLTAFVSVSEPFRDTVFDDSTEYRSYSGSPLILKEGERPAEPPSSAVTISSHFKLVFLSVLGLTIAFVIGYLAISVLFSNPTPGQQAAAETLKALLMAGFGAIVGLLGGKTIT